MDIQNNMIQFSAVSSMKSLLLRIVFFLIPLFLFSGKRISTKAVGKKERHDITGEYKFEEGSVLERASVRNALLKRSNVAVRPARKGK